MPKAPSAMKDKESKVEKLAGFLKLIKYGLLIPYPVPPILFITPLVLLFRIPTPKEEYGELISFWVCPEKGMIDKIANINKLIENLLYIQVQYFIKPNQD